MPEFRLVPFGWCDTFQRVFWRGWLKLSSSKYPLQCVNLLGFQCLAERCRFMLLNFSPRILCLKTNVCHGSPGEFLRNQQAYERFSASWRESIYVSIEIRLYLSFSDWINKICRKKNLCAEYNSIAASMRLKIYETISWWAIWYWRLSASWRRNERSFWNT